MATSIKTISLSPIWSKICEDFNISPSKAVKDGIALHLALNYPDFPRNELEEALYNESKVPAFKSALALRIAAIYSNNKNP